MKNAIFPLLLLLVTIHAQKVSENIRINQVGYFTNGPKLAVVVTDDSGSFKIKSEDLSKTFFAGKFTTPEEWKYSKEKVSTIDFSNFREEGKFVIEIPGIGKSYPFQIKNRALDEVLKSSLKSFYLQRMSIPLEEKYAGKWYRTGGHPDTNVLVHASAATKERPDGFVISAPGGWYDAGDYNKYIINSGISVYSLLAAYEAYPDLLNNLKTNIPETGNLLPDILNEAKYNIDWMLKMQDPNDGGVYHKLTHASFQGMVMPSTITADRYVVQKSTGAALDFAAVTAQAARVYKAFLPEFAEQCLKASEYAFKWAERNPDIYYNQNEINKKYDPDIMTGGYGDSNFDDEYIWASAELFITTGNEDYYNKIKWEKVENAGIPSWNYVYMLPVYSMLRHLDNLKGDPAEEIKKLKEILLVKANSLLNEYQKSAYRVTIGENENDFPWGSNSVAANQGMLLLQAYNLTKNKEFIYAAQSDLDYLFGKNATGYCFLTGAGSKSPMYPHHRPSEADGVTDPVPGLLVGGPQNVASDAVTTYKGTQPATKYLDVMQSYTTNEVAINWNAPLVYLLAGLEDYYSK